MNNETFITHMKPIDVTRLSNCLLCCDFAALPKFSDVAILMLASCLDNMCVDSKDNKNGCTNARQSD